MEEYMTGAENKLDAIAGASEGGIGGEELFSRYESGASVDELNELLSSAHQDAEENTNAGEEDPGANETETHPVSGGGVTDAADNSGAKRFSQKDLDYIIGKKTGEQARKHSALLDDLAVVLGVDREKVVEAVRRQRYEMEADEKGVADRELYARAVQAENENKEFRQKEAEETVKRRFLDDVESQRLSLTKEVPDFDMSQAVENERFVFLLDTLWRNPETKDDAVRLAYRAVFFDDSAEKIRAQEREKIISSVKSGQARMAEGAKTSQSGQAPKINVGKMTDAQIAEMAERALNGEKITL